MRSASEGRDMQPESQPESLAKRVVSVLASGPLGKTEIATSLGMKVISGRLNQVIRELLKEGSIEMSRPESPNSRLQKYRLVYKVKKMP